MVYSLNVVCQISKSDIFPDKVTPEFVYIFNNNLSKTEKYNRFKAWVTQKRWDLETFVFEYDDPSAAKVIIKVKEPLNLSDSYEMDDFDVANAYTITRSDKKISYKLSFECKEDRIRLKITDMKKCYMYTQKIVTGLLKGYQDVKYVDDFDIVGYCNTNADHYQHNIDSIQKTITKKTPLEDRKIKERLIYMDKKCIEKQPEKEMT